VEEPGSLAGVRAVEDAYQLKTYAKLGLALERGRGAYVFDADGRRYLDFYGGHCVATTGHCHPHVVAAIREQAEKLLFYSNVVYSGIRAEAARAVVGLAPPGMTQVFFCNSGTEANEHALLAARRHTGRTTVLAMHGGFHGRTAGSLSVTGLPKYRPGPPPPGVRFVEFGQLDGARRELEAADGDAAAVILEPVQSMAGVCAAPADYYRGLRRLCDRAGTLLVFDEVQTGFGRTGANFFCQTVGVTPDLITCAKGMASGVPMGAVLFSEATAARIVLGAHGSTFGGGPLACAAARATAEVLAAERLPDNAARTGAYLMESLRAGGICGLAEVRGAGLLIGVEFKAPAAGRLVQAMLRRGVLIGGSEDPRTVRLLPPLVIGRPECDEALAALRDAAAEVFAEAAA
jgi:acetylornithine/succinyldiaminopimelate/putrescine aminotransferase